MTSTTKEEVRLNWAGQELISSAFDAETTAEEVLEGRDLTGKTAIVTGGGNGIGFEISRALAKAGASVTIADVDVASAEASTAKINTETGRRDVETREIDLASLASAQAFADAYAASGKPLDILINNAGVMAPPLKRTAEGHELQLGINHLGHYRMTMGLLPVLRAGNGARVVTVSSIGHRRSDILYDDPDYLTRPYDRWEAYGQSKTACALFALGLTKRYSGDGIFANTMNPGGSMTGLQRFLTDQEQRDLGWIDDKGNVTARWRSPEQCAATAVWIATAPETEGVGGRYFEECNESGPWHEDRPMNGVHTYAASPENADRLWELTERLLGQ
ncbi:SDR family NAD(P)-dependent oxidoreductase [uncultured Roseibium sp.]|uniref:SDR family NAD(P)-dependent oxidoreductase n=1 Tax=uncultured Roseibium sp. TaxID=1936171 RepID=UPI003216D824